MTVLGKPTETETLYTLNLRCTLRASGKEMPNAIKSFLDLFNKYETIIYAFDVNNPKDK